jgi:hypothetical protein
LDDSFAISCALTQEMKFDNENGGLKNRWCNHKMFTSGGDLIEGRQRLKCI